MGLWENEFDINLNVPNTKDLLNKISASNRALDTAATEKALKSRKLTDQERVALIIEKVNKVLGKQKKNVLVIRTRADLYRYISGAIAAGRCAVDTETNNSLDPVTCKLMGLCLYYPGGKQAYIPINHVDIETRELLPNQLTTDDCREALQRLLDAKVYILMHNGKFDYEVIKCTCGIEVKPNWDTIIAARLLDENEFSSKQTSLKYIYVKYIDPSQEKYSIEGLFENIAYAIVPPETFALYAATDSLMTDKIYEWQKPQFERPENARLYWVFQNIEMPIVQVTAEMELTGVCIDLEFGERLRLKYNQLLAGIDTKINAEISRASLLIEEWKKTPYAVQPSRQYAPKKTKMTLAKLEATYPSVDKETGRRYKTGKAPRDQLADPINLASSTQLAILFYDVLACGPVINNKTRGTGKEELEALQEKLEAKVINRRLNTSKDLADDDLRHDIAFNLCSEILERRGIAKLVTTYLDVIPNLARHWPDKRIRFHLNSLGTDTGRYSSGGKIKWMDESTYTPIEVSGINIQNIPARGDGKITRMLFTAAVKDEYIEPAESVFDVAEYTEVETIDGWKYGKDLKIGDMLLITDESPKPIKNITFNNKRYLIYA